MEILYMIQVNRITAKHANFQNFIHFLLSPFKTEKSNQSPQKSIFRFIYASLVALSIEKHVFKEQKMLGK